MTDDLHVSLTYDEAVILLDKAVQTKGEDYVYRPARTPWDTGCAYFHGKKPGCIIGHLFALKGVTAYDLGEIRNVMAVGDLIDNGFLTVEDVKTHRLLVEAQSLQDVQVPWGQAVASAKDSTS